MSTNRHSTVDNLDSLLKALLERHRHEPTTSELASAADVHRDTARKLLRGMAERGWVRVIERQDGERWAMGTALVHIGITFQQLTIDHMEELQCSYEQMSTPKHKRAALRERARLLRRRAAASS